MRFCVFVMFSLCFCHVSLCFCHANWKHLTLGNDGVYNVC